MLSAAPKRAMECDYDQGSKWFCVSRKHDPKGDLRTTCLVAKAAVPAKRYDETVVMEHERLERIKRLTIIALFVDDELMDTLVLKGGNALDIVYRISSRASIDLDLSIEGEFDSAEIDSIKLRIEKALLRVFNENGFDVFDVKLEERPEVRGPGTPDFWGGYQLEFKLADRDVYSEKSTDIAALRRNAEVVGPRNIKKLRVDISKREYCEPKIPKDLDGYTVYVYPPEMIALEKLRAICQQTQEYCDSIGKSHREGRARDFFDIYTVLEHYGIDLTAPKNADLIKRVFAAKNVSLDLISTIADSREFHRPDFKAVENTVKPQTRIRDFDFYFDYVVDECKRLAEALGIEQPPLA